ncbi:lipopolysaccharide biosynthesis protein [Actinomycetospora sp. CA-084318]|uniref:lipopolysaccharide biosynthesis protein n=1 Tax=Actinomycetospora sp. CA-084318 TaxID=3239892 RepID=UPI003D982247
MIATSPDTDSPSEDRAATPGSRALLTSGLAANGTALGLSALVVALTALVLGAEGRGQIAVATVIASYTVVAVGLSLESGILHFGRAADVGSARRFRRRVTLLVLATFAVAVVVLAVAAFVAVRPTLPLPVIAVFAVGYAAPIVVVPATALDRLDGRHHAATWRPVWVLVAQQVGGGVGLLVAADVTAFLLGGGLAGLGATALTLYLHRRGSTLRHAAEDVALPGHRDLLAYSVAGHGGVVLHLFALRAPLIVLSAVVGASAAGQFSIATSLAEISLIVSQSQLGRVLAAATTDPASFAVLRRELVLGAVLCTLLGCGLAVVASVAPRLLGPEFAGVFWPTLVLLPGMVALGAWRLATNDLAARGHPGARTTSAAAGAVVVAVGLAVLVPSFGLLGAATAASVGFAVMALTLRLLPLRPRPTEEFA